MIYAVKKQYELALAESERAIALDPNLADSYAQRAENLNAMGRPEEALSAAQQAIRLNPRGAGPELFNLSFAYFMMDNYPDAIPPLNSLLLRNPNWLAAYMILSFSYTREWIFQLSQDRQVLTQATEAAQRAVVQNPSYWPAHLALGFSYLYQRQHERALVEMEQAINLDANEALSYAVLAEALSLTGKADEALHMAEEALRRKPVVVDSYLAWVGSAYSLVGKPAEAIAPLQQYLRRHPHDLVAHLNLAAGYSELGKEAEARLEAAEVLRINPKFSLEIHKQRVPIKDPATLERHLVVLRKAELR